MFKINLAAALSVAVISLPALPVWSNEQPRSQYGFPVIPTEDLDMKTCYMVTTAGRSLDLARLCGSVPAASTGSTIRGASITPASERLNRRSSGELGLPVNTASPLRSNSECPPGGRDANGYPCIRIRSSNELSETGSSGLGLGRFSNPTPTNSTTGVCNSPDDVDALGRRCGGRASNVRPGGR